MSEAGGARPLLIAAGFPTLGGAADGQGVYVSEAGRALAARLGAPLQVLSLRFPGQAERESAPWCDVQRVDPGGAPDIFALYEPPHFARGVRALAGAAASIAAPGQPLWCHGYETGAALRAIRRRLGADRVGRSAAVLHYLVAQESLHDLAVGDDPVRAEAFDSPIAAAAGRLCPPSLRPALIRASTLGAPIGRRLPAPPIVRQQLHKLSLERALIHVADQVVAVGPSFARAILRHHPVARGKTGWCVAGAPSPEVIPAPDWPSAPGAHSLRLIAAGRPTGQKGWDYLAAALALLEAREPALAARIELAIVGGLGDWGGPWSAYSERVAAALGGLRRVRVHRVGAVHRARVLALMAGADALVAPSVFEPLGLVILEAMAAGCVVVGSDADGPGDLLRPPWGTLVPFEAPRERVEGLAAALVGLARLPRGALEARKRAAAEASRAYTWSACAGAHAAALGLDGEAPQSRRPPSPQAAR